MKSDAERRVNGAAWQHAGWLEKQVESTVGWRQRYFVLTADRLSYFQSKRDAAAGSTKPNATVWSLAACTLSNHRVGGLSTHWHLCLNMHPEHNSKRSSSWILSSSRREDILKWVEKLREAGAADEYRVASSQSVNWAALRLASPSSRQPRGVTLAWAENRPSALGSSQTIRSAEGWRAEYMRMWRSLST